MDRMYYMSKATLFDFRRLSFCKVTGDGCVALASALRSDHCSLRELDLSFNHLSDQGVKMLTEIQRDPRCRLEKLKYAQTGCITNALTVTAVTAQHKILYQQIYLQDLFHLLI